jgi:hypothetical protein
MNKEFAAASTIEIATQARVSKRERYALIGNKQEMPAARINARAKRMQAPSDLPAPHNRESRAKILSAFGAQLLREVSDRWISSDARSAPQYGPLVGAPAREK